MQKKIILFDIDYTMFNTGLYKDSELTLFQIFDEVVSVLTALKDDVTIGIFSEGELEHQIKKLVETDIKQYFHDEHLHIFSKKLEALPQVLEKYRGEQLYFIDDKLEVLKHLKEMDPTIKTIWIKRGAYAESVPEIPGFTPDEIVLHLEQVIPFIRKS